MDEDRQLDPAISLAFVLNLRVSKVSEVREALAALEDVRVVLSRLGPPRTLWIREGEGP